MQALCKLWDKEEGKCRLDIFHESWVVAFKLYFHTNKQWNCSFLVFGCTTAGEVKKILHEKLSNNFVLWRHADVIITRGFYCVKITFLYFSYLHNLKINIISHDIHPSSSTQPSSVLCVYSKKLEWKKNCLVSWPHEAVAMKYLPVKFSVEAHCTSMY